jgi:hypothetical protein
LPTGEAYTGGVPGANGAGNTTGPHLDIVIKHGRSLPNISQTANNYANMLNSISQKRGKIDIGQLFNKARKYAKGRVVAIANSPDKLEKFRKKGLKIKRFII